MSDASSPASGTSQGAGGYAGSAGAVAGGGKAGQAGMGGMVQVSQGLVPSGSVDVVLSTVGGVKPTGKNKASPSLDTPFRVDFVGAALAIVTPRWGSPSEFQIADKNGSLVLMGSATVRSGDATDVWQSFSLELDATHKLTGKVTAVGQESVYDGAVGTSVAVSATGAVKPDKTAPEAKATLSTTFTGGARLPWEPIAVRFSEPISSADAFSHLRLQAGSSTLVATWEGGPDGADGKSGIVTASAFLASFDESPSPHRVSVLGGFRDAAMNAGASAEETFDVLSVPTSDAMPNPFATATVGSFATWGPVEVSTTLAAPGCLALGAIWLGSCDVAPAGVAGRTKMGGGTKLQVRYRVVATSKVSGVAPSLGALPALSILAGAPGHAPTSKEIASPSLTEVTADGKYTTSWITASVPLPYPTDTEIGWAIRAGSLTSSQACTAGPSEIDPVAATILIDSVTVK